MNISSLLAENSHIILFDGICHLCSWSVRFVHRWDNKDLYKFVWIQDELSAEILDWVDKNTDPQRTVILIRQGEVFTKSRAILEIAKDLQFPWSVLSIFKIVPTGIRDKVYDWIASNRYSWFGKKRECVLPSDDLRERFIIQS